MKDILLFWAEKGVDGFRCDMAEMVPVEFWGWVITEVQTRFPDLIFIAEIYNPAEYHTYLFKGHFTYLYDKVGLYDALRRLIEGHGSVEDITRVWQRESGNFSNRMLRFLENHDEQRIASSFFAGDAFAAIPAMVLSATLHSGPLMIYFGQELGVNPTESEGFQGNDGRTTIFDYWGIPEFQRWVNQHKYDGEKLLPQEKELRSVYQWLNWFIQQNEAVYYGEFHDLQYLNAYGQSPNYYGHRVYSYLRFTKKQVLVFVYNFDKQTTFDTYIKISQGVWENTLDLRSLDTYSLRMLSPKGETRATEIIPHTIFENGIPVHLTPSSFVIFEIKR
jgi:glycosidase